VSYHTKEYKTITEASYIYTDMICAQRRKVISVT